MVQAADLRDASHRPAIRWFDGSWKRRIALERQVRSAVVIVVEVSGEDALQVGFVEDDDVVEAFAAERADEPLDVRVLPRRAWSAKHFVDAQAFDPCLEIVAVDVPVSVVRLQEAWSGIEGKGLEHLLCRP